MKQLTINGKTLGVADVPEDAHCFTIYQRNIGNGLMFSFVGGGEHDWDDIEISPGQWSILGRLNDITEEQAVSIFNEYLLALHKIFERNGITGNPLIILNEKV